MQIYLDYSATTPPHPLVLAKVQEVCTEGWGNPSSLHVWGNRSATLVEMARMQVAGLVGAMDPATITFTAGGTEADNLAIFGITDQFDSPQHLIISSVEHPAIAQPAAYLESKGWQVTRLGVDQWGRVNPAEFAAAIQPNTVLASVIHGQSEIGTIQPIEELGAIARKHGVLFHTDAVQTAGRIPLNVEELPVDLLSLSSHKIYGLQGTGALYVRNGLKLQSQLLGGGQENKLRSGTQGVPGIAAFGVAAELAADNLETESARLQKLRELCFELLADCEDLKPTGDRRNRLPHHISFIISDDSPLRGITGKQLVRQLNLAGIGISAGSACHSGTLSPSKILKAMGLSDTESLSGIRLSCGAQTQKEDIEWTAITLKQILERQVTALIPT